MKVRKLSFGFKGFLGKPIGLSTQWFVLPIIKNHPLLREKATIA
jgi:hypothetical protein